MRLVKRGGKLGAWVVGMGQGSYRPGRRSERVVVARWGVVGTVKTDFTTNLKPMQPPGWVLELGAVFTDNR